MRDSNLNPICTRFMAGGLLSFVRLLSETSGIFFLFFILSFNSPYIVIVLMQQKPGQVFKPKIEVSCLGSSKWL